MKLVRSKWSRVRKSLLCIAVCTMLLAISFTAEAQHPKRIPRVGFVVGVRDSDPRFEAFRQGLRDLGYNEGKDILLEYRPAEQKERSRSQFAELLKLKIDLYVSGNLPAIQAAKEATRTIPIVIVTQADPVSNRLIDSLARPGGNITGLTTISRELSGKRLELVKEVVPELSRVGVLWDENSQGGNIGFKEYEAAARSLKISLQSLKVRSQSSDFDAAFQVAVKGRVGAIIPIRSVELTRHINRVTELAIKNRTPSMCERSEYIEAGCLMSYATNDADQFRRAAVYVDKILKGAKPADLPVEQPTKFEFIINLKTAKQIGITIPPNVLARADKVIR